MEAKHIFLSISAINELECLVSMLEEVFINFKTSSYPSETIRYVHFYQGVSEALKSVNKDQMHADLESLVVTFITARELIKTMNSASFDSDKAEISHRRYAFKDLHRLFCDKIPDDDKFAITSNSVSDLQKMRSILHEINVICNDYNPSLLTSAPSDIKKIKEIIETGKSNNENYIWEK